MIEFILKFEIFTFRKTFLFRPCRFSPEDCSVLREVLNDPRIYKLGNEVTDDLERLKKEGYITSRANFSAVEFRPLYKSLGENFGLKKSKSFYKR